MPKYCDRVFKSVAISKLIKVDKAGIATGRLICPMSQPLYCPNVGTSPLSTHHDCQKTELSMFLLE